MARIVVLGGTGYAGGNVVREAVARGHEVTSVSRSMPDDALGEVVYRTGDVTDPAFVGTVLDGADVVVVALSPRADMAGRVRDAIAAVARQAQAAGVRLGVIGGAGSLLVAPGGPRLVDTDAFPAEYKDEALELTGVLDDLRGSADALDWFFVSPAAAFGGFNPGERTGDYRVGVDVLLADADGRSFISGADLAIAVLDEIEQPTHRRTRFTVAY